MRKPTIWVPTRSDRNRPVQSQKMVSLEAGNFKFKKKKDFTLCSKNKGADQLAATVKLVCAFVFAYANCWFSVAAAHLNKSCLQSQ